MAEETGISWADMTFNPWIGCARVSPACDGCYAAALMGTEGRHKRAEWGGPGVGAGTRSRTAASTWKAPRRWDKKAAAEGTRPFVFCASLADVFDNEVPHEWRRDLFDLIRATPNLTWLLLTKRPGMILKLWDQVRASSENVDVDWDGPGLGWPRNAAIGCTVVNQEEAERDVPKLLRAKGALNPAFAFLSMEPLLGPVNLWALRFMDSPHRTLQAFDGLDSKGVSQFEGGIDWVITGGETSQGGHQARPQNPDWFRSLRDQAVEARVAYHHKQNGEWSRTWPHVDGANLLDNEVVQDGWVMMRVGKEKAGRLLDGRTWDERPFLEVVGS